MSDYYELKRATSAVDSSFFINGTLLYTVQGVYNTQYRCAYFSDNPQTIRVGVYRNFDRYNFVLVSKNALNPIDIRLVSTNSYDETILVKSIDRIDTEFNGGYRNGFAVNPDAPIINVTVFNSLNECLEAIKFPGGGSGGGTDYSADIVVEVSVSEGGTGEITVEVSGEGESAGLITVNITSDAISDNPYNPGGDSDPGGGGGSFDNPSDIIPLPDLPINGVNPLIKLWNPSSSEVEELSSYLFNTDIWDSVKRSLFGNPIQYIVSFGLVPGPISIGSIKENFTLGNQGSNITMYGVSQQYVRKSLGTLTIPAYWQSFMDYEPHTKIQFYLPFIGYRDVIPSEVIGKPVEIVYHIDYFSGSCVAFIRVSGSVLYQFNGNCLSTIPYASNEFGNLLSGSMGVVGGLATGVIALTGGFAPAIGNLMAMGGFGGAFSSVLSLPKETVSHGGNVSATNGLLSSRIPFVILNRPKQAVADLQNEYHGYATWYRAADFNNARGYIKLAEIHLHDVPATDWEVKEIERLLKEGVIF